MITQLYCPGCGHKLDINNDRRVAGFTSLTGNRTRFTCGMIECINLLLNEDWEFIGILHTEEQLTCGEDDCN